MAVPFLGGVNLRIHFLRLFASFLLFKCGKLMRKGAATKFYFCYSPRLAAYSVVINLPLILHAFGSAFFAFFVKKLSEPITKYRLVFIFVSRKLLIFC